jgi:hypothetical protein
MARDRIEQHLHEGPPDEPRYPGTRFVPPAGDSGTLGRTRFLAPMPSLVGAVVVLIAALLIALLRAGEPGLFPGTAPDPTASPTPTSTATATPAANGCTERELRLIVTFVEGAAGSRILNFTVSNDGFTACSLAVGRALILDLGESPPSGVVDTRPAPAPRATVGPRSSVKGLARWANHCGAAPRGPLEFIIDVPTTRLAAPVPVDPELAVPPCLGSGAPSLEVRFET